jgi:glycosyltransferase involved in cell wall biosynthesis
MFVSVIICTVRRPALVRALLDSLSAQTWRGFEILLVGAEENSDPIDCSARVRVLGAPHGLAAARNVGLRNAAGDVICFLDDDVLLPPTFLAEAVRLLEQSDLKLTPREIEQLRAILERESATKEGDKGTRRQGDKGTG